MRPKINLPTVFAIPMTETKKTAVAPSMSSNASFALSGKSAFQTVPFHFKDPALVL